MDNKSVEAFRLSIVNSCPIPNTTFAFVWEKGKIMDFSETIVVYDI